jgi:hypothetical protein
MVGVAVAERFSVLHCVQTVDAVLNIVRVMFM